MIYLPESEEKTETSQKTFFGAFPGVPAPLTQPISLIMALSISE